VIDIARKYHKHQVTKSGSEYNHKIKIVHRSEFGRREHEKEINSYKKDMSIWRKAYKKIKSVGGRVRKYRKKIFIASVPTLLSLLAIISLIPGVTVTGLTDVWCGEYCEIPFQICTYKYNLVFKDDAQPFYFEGNATLEYIYDDSGNNFTFNGKTLYIGNCWNLTAVVKKDKFDGVKYGFKAGDIDIDPWLYPEKPKDKDTVYKDGIGIISPYHVNCVWDDPLSEKRRCDIVIEIYNWKNNKIPIYDFNTLWKTTPEKMNILYSIDYKYVTETYINRTCLDDTNIEIFMEDTEKTEEYYLNLLEEYCSYNKTRKVFYNWKEGTPKTLDVGVVGIKLTFDSIPQKIHGIYEKNSFNLSLNNIILDPDITVCTDITSPGTYTMTANITDATDSYCINISSTDVIFDCNGHRIDGNNVADYGIYSSFPSSTDTNITIKNCDLTDWDTYYMYFSYADSLTIDNTNILDYKDDGISTYICKNLTIKNSWFRGGVGSSYQAAYFTTAEYINITNTKFSGTSADGELGIIHLRFSDSPYMDNVEIDPSDNGMHISMDPSSDNDCIPEKWNVFDPEDNRAITIIRQNISDWYNNVSQLIVCRADNTVVENITIDGSERGESGGIYVAGSSYVNISYSNISNTGNHIMLDYNSNYAIIENNEFNYNRDYGIWLFSTGVGTEIKNNVFFNPSFSEYNIYIQYPDDIIIHNNTITHKSYAIRMTSSTNNCTIYNNFFNYTGSGSPVYIYSYETDNHANTTKQVGTRVYSSGNYIGGNYYTNISGNGWSEECSDSNHDGFCDDIYSHSNIYDFLPYSDEYIPDTGPPKWYDIDKNNTIAGNDTLFTARWTDDLGLSGYIFGWYNGKNWTKTSDSGDIESGEQSFSGESGGSSWTTFFDNFDDNDLGSNWTTYRSDTTYGRIGVRSEGAHSGSYSVIADVNSNGHYNLNELITAFDFSGATEVTLSFWHREWSDEETNGADHSGHYNSDAYYYTCDGSNWKLLGNLGSVGSTWTKVDVDISSDPDWCGTANSNFKIKFTQYDNYKLTSDGRGFDDINISYKTTGGSPDQDVNKTPVEYSDVISNIYEKIENITITVGVSYYNNSGSTANGNTNPTLWLEVYNGTNWLDEGDFSVSSTGNHTITLTTPSILSAWKTKANRDIRISARYMDYKDAGNYDTIKWNGVWVSVYSQQEYLNDSWVEMSGTLNYSNISKTLTSTNGATIKWYVYANDTVGNINFTGILQFTTTGGDTDPPTYSNWQQDPPDLNSSSLGKLYINVTITDASGVNDSSVEFYHWINDSQYPNQPWCFINGTAGDFEHKHDMTNTSSVFNITLHTYAYNPSTHNVHPDTMRSATKYNHSLDSNNNALKVRFHNISTHANTTYILKSKLYRNSGNLLIYYCNSSYTTGKVYNSDYCVPLTTLTSQAATTYQNIHFYGDENSYLDGVKITSTGYIVFYALVGSDWEVEYANIDSNSVETSGNGGTGWSNQDFSADTWLIQLNGNGLTTIGYKVYACDTLGNCGNSSIQEDSYAIANLPPSPAPKITIPQNLTYNGTFNITWNPSKDPNNDPFNYSLYLYYSNDTLADILADNNIPEGTEYYTFNSANYPDGQYYLIANATDNASNTNFYILPYHFTLDNFEPDVNLSFGPPNTNAFVFSRCGPDFQNDSALPINQTNTYGIDYICNNGTESGDIQIKLSSSLNQNWTIWADNESSMTNPLKLSTAWQTIYYNMAQGSCGYVWFKANCSYVHIGPGAYEMYQAV